jgi:hypothetical protein
MQCGKEKMMDNNYLSVPLETSLSELIAIRKELLVLSDFYRAHSALAVNLANRSFEAPPEQEGGDGGTTR